jgi:zinc D-Ala-D-Ala carboxypeptidase
MLRPLVFRCAQSTVSMGTHPGDTPSGSPGHMDAAGIAGIQQRIAQIEARFAMPATLAPVRTATAGKTADASFAGALETAITKTAATKHANHAKHTGRLSPPPELEQYGNGRIPEGALQTIGVGNHRLWAPAATAFKHMAADARAAGVDIGVTDSYRSYDQQVDVARRKGLYSQGGLAATPGTSNHGWGMSLDLDLNGRALSWMRDNAGRYGFVEDVPREPWHWTFHGTQ